MEYVKHARGTFWDKVEKTPTCWLWRAAKTRWGYGVYRSKPAHRVSYMLAYGPIPENKPYICHTCDNPACVNPNHLFAGSPKDNIRDAVLKGRNMRGEKQHRHVLTETEVRQIRLLASQGKSGAELARRYGICVSSACDVINRTSWRHVT